MKREQILLSTMSDAQLDHAGKLIKREHTRRLAMATSSKKTGTRKSTGKRAQAAA
jgi:hypothetical protein